MKYLIAGIMGALINILMARLISDRTSFIVGELAAVLIQASSIVIINVFSVTKEKNA